MSESATAMFACTNCGKTYHWKPQFAGKKLKCSCGQLMQAPDSFETPPPEPAAPESTTPEPQLDDLYSVATQTPKPAPKPKQPQPPAGGPPCPACGQPLATQDAVLCIHCGHNLKSGKKIKSKLTSPAKSTPAAPATAVAGYFTGPQRLQADPEPGFDLFQAKQTIIPLALVVIGTALTVLLGMRHSGTRDIGERLLILSFGTGIDLVLILIGIFAAAKILGISFGAFGPAILKICAVSLTPGAIASLIVWIAPGTNGLIISWFASGLLYYGLFMFLFDLDLGETMICTAIIWVIRNWIGLIVLGMLLAALGRGI